MSLDDTMATLPLRSRGLSRLSSLDQPASPSPSPRDCPRGSRNRPLLGSSLQPAYHDLPSPGCSTFTSATLLDYSLTVFFFSPCEVVYEIARD